MRVHPDFFTPKPPAWRFPLFFSILLGLLVFVVVRGPHQVVNAAQIKTSQSELKVEAIVDSNLKTVEEATVAVPLSFETLAPQRGARVALTLNEPHGGSIVIVEEAWVSKSVGREVVLRLNPDRALVLQAARSYGNFNFIEIPARGSSPYTGQGVADSEALAQLMRASAPMQPHKPEVKAKQKGFAWIPGESRGFGLEESGKIKPLGNQ